MLKKINNYRRAFTQRVTKNIGHSNFRPNIDLFNKADIKTILVCRPNQRLGNQLLITPLIQEIVATFPGCKIDLFVKGGLSPLIFKNYDNVNTIIQLPSKHFKHLGKYIKSWLSLKKKKYDLVINVDKNSSSGRLSTQHANSKYKFIGDETPGVNNSQDNYNHFAKYPIYNLRNYLTLFGVKNNDEPIPSLNLKLSLLEIEEGGRLLKKITKNEKQTICIFTNATGSKCYSESWWETFYTRLKTAFPEYNIVEVLPAENISRILFKAPSFYSKDIREIGSFIANSKIFISADSGIMHLASASQTPTVGLFSADNLNKYQPYNNNSVGINTNDTGLEDWITIIKEILLK